MFPLVKKTRQHTVIDYRQKKRNRNVPDVCTLFSFSYLSEVYKPYTRTQKNSMRK